MRQKYENIRDYKIFRVDPIRYVIVTSEKGGDGDIDVVKDVEKYTFDGADEEREPHALVVRVE